ncbi:hypothetical protein R3W88_019708 [Solanum pinnatisectum]|uniref:Uncharacterized protein n=1 Tax=Solanum pinnatisectum TaxID=50273 RepID=A0AAV9KK35_9SOLN|nr:hypothetical protein R3W88_019708 [Solanum pinnatisectum]
MNFGSKGKTNNQDVMKRLKQLEEKGKRWTEEYSPYSMDLYHDFRMIAQGSFNEAVGPSESMRKSVSKEKVDAVPKRSKNNGKEKIVSPPIATVDEDEVECGIESKDKDTVVAPKVISKEKNRLQMKKLQQQPLGSRRINFRGDENGASIPTNLPYSPKNLTCKRKTCVISN